MQFGKDAGKYFSSQGIPMEMCALPPSNTGPYSTFRVIKPFTVERSIISPAFGKPGFGIQYRAFKSASELISEGYLGRNP